MNMKEYVAQKAVGTIDYLAVAIVTSDSRVLADIVENTQNKDVQMAIAVNPKTDYKTLTRLIIERDMPDHILNTCIWHPSLTLKMLAEWGLRSYIKVLMTFKTRMYALQVVDGVPAKKRVRITESEEIDFTAYGSIYEEFLKQKQQWPVPQITHKPFYTDNSAAGNTTTTTTTGWTCDDPIDSMGIKHASSNYAQSVKQKTVSMTKKSEDACLPKDKFIIP